MFQFQVKSYIPLQDPSLFREALAALPWPRVRERILRYQLEKDRLLALLAWRLAAEMLKEAGVTDFRLEYSSRGKPRLAACPGLHFNLSHGGKLALCAVSSEPVGVDTEPVRAWDADAAAFAFSAPEIAWAEKEPDQALAFTRLWVKKESYVKCLGTGLSAPLKDLCLIPGQAFQQEHFFREIFMEGHCLSLCSSGGLPPA